MAFSFSILLLSRTVLALVPLFLVFRGILVPPRGYLTSSGCFHPFAKNEIFFLAKLLDSVSIYSLPQASDLHASVCSESSSSNLRVTRVRGRDLDLITGAKRMGVWELGEYICGCAPGE